KACTRSPAPVGRRTLHFAKPPRRSKRRNPKAYLRWKWRLPPSTPSPKARARRFSASRTSPIRWDGGDKTSERARRTEPPMPCKFSKQSSDRFRLEHTLSESLNAATARGDAAAPADEATLRLPPLRNDLNAPGRRACPGNGATRSGDGRRRLRTIDRAWSRAGGWLRPETARRCARYGGGRGPLGAAATGRRCGRAFAPARRPPSL